MRGLFTVMYCPLATGVWQLAITLLGPSSCKGHLHAAHAATAEGLQVGRVAERGHRLGTHGTAQQVENGLPLDDGVRFAVDVDLSGYRRLGRGRWWVEEQAGVITKCAFICAICGLYSELMQPPWLERRRSLLVSQDLPVVLQALRPEVQQ
jgi:hypothetical protein